MNFLRFISVAVCLTLILVCLAGPAQARVYIDINQPFVKKIPVAIPDFRPLNAQSGGLTKISQGLAARLGDNLDLTGMFVILDKRTFIESDTQAGLEGNKEVNFKEWLTIGGELLVKGAFSLSGDELSLELRLFDIFEGRMLLGKRYTGRKKDARRMINRFTNDIIYILTGELGIFGTQIVFVGYSGGRKQLFLTELGGENAVRLTSGPTNSTWPVISPSGGEIVYSTRRSRGEILRLLKLGGGERTVSSGANLHLTPCFTPKGWILTAISGRHNTNIFLLDPNGGKPIPITKHWGINISPTVSPDGTQMAFVSNRAGGPQIYISPVNGGEARRLTIEGKENTDPQWSPRGDRIVYVGASKEGSRDIFTINPDGSDRQQLTSGAGRNTRPSWSPDGRMIVFASTRLGRPLLFTMTANGERQRPLKPDYRGAQLSPFWSPAKPPGLTN